MNKISAPRGTADILPDALAAWEILEAKSRQILKCYGYRELRTPFYEETALFKRSLGQTSDIVNKQLLELATTKEEGYALRPEGTASVVRSYLENSFDKREALSKFFYIGPMFRGERPQKGRYRQFHQIGVEAIGPKSVCPYLDAEILALAMHLLKALEVKSPKLRINSLGSKEDKKNIGEWLGEKFSRQVNDLCEDCQVRLERNAFRILDCKNESCKKVAGSLITNLPLSEASIKYFKDVQFALCSLDIPFEVSPHLVRGLDYYTHTVFEITAEGLGSQDAIAAGGRYDSLIHALGGDIKTEFGAIGFAMGIERLLLASGNNQADAGCIDAYVIAMDAAYQKSAFELVDSLRKNNISADMSYTGGSIKSQMGRANKLNARLALILGEDEIKNQSVSVKDMSIGEQEIVALEDIIGLVKRKLNAKGLR